MTIFINLLPPKGWNEVAMLLEREIEKEEQPSL